MSTPVPVPPTTEEVGQAVENVGNALGWFARLVEAIKRAFKKPMPPGAALALLAMTTLSCSTAQIGAVGAGLAGAGTVIKIIGSVKVPPPPPDTTPRAIPSATPTPVPTAATATPAPSSTPTRVPTWEPTATPTVAPTPEPCRAAPPAPAWPVSVAFPGGCPRGFEPLSYEASTRYAPPGTTLCAARSTCDYDGHGACPGSGDRASWAMGYNLNQGQILEEIDGRWMVYDGGRGCKDAYGRFFHENQGCRVLYTHPTDPMAIWTYNGIAPALECPTGTPIPAPTPTSKTCELPRADGRGLQDECVRTSPRLLGDVDSAISRVLWAHPSWLALDDSGNALNPAVIVAGQENPFRNAVVDDLRAAGFCTFFDGEEVAIKNTNDWSEQYHILTSANNVRRGDGSYRATCTPAWSAIPATSEAHETPILTLVRVGDHCQNPTTGPKFAQNICIVTTTGVYRNPRTPDDGGQDAPCDREPALTDFCNNESQDDPSGIQRTVVGAEDLGLDEGNPQQIVVRFTRGQAFTVCARPFADAHNAHGQPIRVLGPAESCRTQRYD